MTGRCLSGLEVSDRATGTPRTRGPSGARPGAAARGGRKPGRRAGGGRLCPGIPRPRAVTSQLQRGEPRLALRGRAGPGRWEPAGERGQEGTGGIPAPPRLLSDGRQATPILPSDGLRDHSPALAEAPGAHPGLSRPGIHRGRYPLCTSGCRRPPWVLELPRVRLHQSWPRCCVCSGRGEGC